MNQDKEVYYYEKTFYFTAAPRNGGCRKRP